MMEILHFLKCENLRPWRNKKAEEWMRICSPIKLIGEITARLLRRLQLCMKYLQCRAELRP